MKSLPATSLHPALAALLLTGLCTGLLTGCTQQAPAYWSGYAEGEYVYVSSPLAGRVEAVAVLAGQTVAKDAPLFSIDAESEQIAQQEAAARLNSAQAQASNLDTGKRRDELAVTQAQLAQARAAEALASHDLQRQQQLAAQGFVSKARAEDAATTLSQSRARVAELAAAVQAAQLPGRQDERTAQRAAAQAAQEVLKQSQWRTRQKQQSAMQAALVAEVYYRVGEYVQPGQPVLSLLPPANIKARFFVPEQDVGTLRAGQAVTISCDGCGTPIPAQISRIATQPEFTPPVIYSNGQRSKLVFMVEARPQLKDATRLKPGQPLDVRLAATASVQGN
ncbi:HlyD family secretion protein [Duganella fentianensis]|nr:HlyD family efflux transporter periplasmic adaptor subunit [Duganella fentianensis]